MMTDWVGAVIVYRRGIVLARTPTVGDRRTKVNYFIPGEFVKPNEQFFGTKGDINHHQNDLRQAIIRGAVYRDIGMYATQATHLWSAPIWADVTAHYYVVDAERRKGYELEAWGRIYKFGESAANIACVHLNDVVAALYKKKFVPKITGSLGMQLAPAASDLIMSTTQE
jgi:hypothetical protein